MSDIKVLTRVVVRGCMSLCVLVAILAVTLSGCFGNPFERGLPAEGGAITREVSYSSEAYPVLNASCSSCHQPGGLAGGTSFVLVGDPLADHPGLLPLVDVDNPLDSVLVTKATGESTHGGGALLNEGTSDYNIIIAWIEQGADNN